MDFAKYLPDGILVGAPISLADSRVLRPYLLERAGISADRVSNGSVIMLAVPYAVPCQKRTVSMYAVAKDYHAYFDALFASVLPALRADFPDHIFAGFADHSPIAEVDAACKAGLGVMGTNGLLLTERHSSYVFLGEIITTLPTDNKALPVGHCPDCGACRRACPVQCRASRLPAQASLCMGLRYLSGRLPLYRRRAPRRHAVYADPVLFGGSAPRSRHSHD